VTNPKSYLDKVNRCAVYLIIKQYIDLLLNQATDADVCFSKFPYVNILAVAKNLGIAAIKYAPPGSLKPNQHGYLDKKRAIIYINKDDSEEQQRFSIAHELFHFIFFRKKLLFKALTLDPSQVDIVNDLADLNEKNANYTDGDEHEGDEIEQIADFFAANLLVPIERFSLWDDKENPEIAEAFDVPKECIRKRRGEVKAELEYILS